MATKPQTPLYKVETIMEKEDYKSFLFTTMFKRNKGTLKFIAFMAVIGSVLLCFTKIGFGVKTFIASWVVLFMALYVLAWIRMEYRYRRTVEQSKSALFGSVTTITFYEDMLNMASDLTYRTSDLLYSDFFRILEMKNYFVFYYTKAEATIVRKKDFADVDLKEFREFIKTKFEGKYQKI